MRNAPWVGLVLAVACGGSDSSAIDGGNSDATSNDGNPNDVVGSDAANDSGGSDSGGNDSGGNDSGSGNDSSAGSDGGTLFPCGNPMTTCNSGTQYCHLQDIGPQPADGGFSGTSMCDPYPGTCGTTPSCSCIPKLTMCTCSDNAGEITVNCGGV